MPARKVFDNCRTLFQSFYESNVLWKSITVNYTSGKFGLRDMIKRVIDLAVPGMVVCIANSLCMAVLVKNPNIIIKLMDPVCCEQYWAIAIKFLPSNHNFNFILLGNQRAKYSVTFCCPRQGWCRKGLIGICK